MTLSYEQVHEFPHANIKNQAILLIRSMKSMIYLREYSDETCV